MSADKINHIVHKLCQDAERTNDPAKLWHIVEKLYQQSAWEEAQRVSLKAREWQAKIEQVMK